MSKGPVLLAEVRKWENIQHVLSIGEETSPFSGEMRWDSGPVSLLKSSQKGQILMSLVNHAGELFSKKNDKRFRKIKYSILKQEVQNMNYRKSLCSMFLLALVLGTTSPVLVSANETTTHQQQWLRRQQQLQRPLRQVQVFS